MDFPIYHITSFDNLEGIIRSGYIYSDSEIKIRGISVCSYSNLDLKNVRFYFSVPACYEGTLADYVPFFFTNRPPMLLRIKYGSGSEVQRSYLHLVTSVRAIQNYNLPFCYTDGHAIMEMTYYYDDLDFAPEVIDWNLIDDTFWGDTEDDPDRKRRKQAEFLVYKMVPWQCIESIVVKDNLMKDKVEECIHRIEGDEEFISCRIAVSVNSAWYY